MPEGGDFAFAQRMNERLRRYHDIFTQVCPPVGTIRVPETERLARADHKWGLAPFHYVKGYYEAALQQLRRLTVTS